ncbi:hypothetical protein BK816_05570 [Boudabousia tangfeifanii]|uniref:Endonuclease/exonuclease/phosphatase domain-containing protein n=1 Tax=Boudabousia tangfeifanii TaxID=1912795 RepID=A0A1D9MKW7_9ACTO|nr:endonuclease/exonuclease/phosphatase family protein [Boudabousia tangfeifanii]AOZ72829.1 hypothetical protein BK816_05570 [Boudabousia tangfeifanii]
MSNPPTEYKQSRISPAQVGFILFWLVVALVLFFWPANWWWFAAAQTFVPYISAILLLTGLFWLIQPPRWGGLAALLAAVLVSTASLYGPRLLSPTAQGGAGSIRVLAANMEFGRGEASSLLHEAKANDIDVIVLVECTGSLAHAISARARGDYPYVSLQPHDESGFEGWILSRYPIAEKRELNSIFGRRDGAFQLPGVTIMSPVGPLRLLGVHAIPPLSKNGHLQWREDMKTIAQWANEDSRPALAIGDFNATSSHPPFRQLLAGANDAIDLASFPAFTWPSVFPLIRIDHALTWNAKPVSAKVFKVPGTDHRGIWTEISMPAQSNTK